MVALIGGLSAAAVAMAMQVSTDIAEEERRAQVLQAAERHVVNLTTVDYRTAQRDVRRLLEGSTGRFQEELRARSELFQKVTTGSRVTSEGEVAAAGIQRVGEDSARVLMAVRAEVRNSARRAVQERNYRLSVRLQHVDGAWLLAEVRFIP